MASSLATLLQNAVNTLLLMAAIFWPIEAVFPARPDQPRFRHEWSLDFTFFLGQHLIFGWSSLLLLGWVANQCQWFSATMSAPLLGLPLVGKVLLAMLLGDLLTYWGHRLQHQHPILWRFHAIHHSSTKLDWIAAHREHPLDGLYTMTLLNLPAIVLGVPLQAALGLIVFRGIWAVFIHSNVRLPLGPLDLVFGSPDLHHWHHAKHGAACNFGNLAPWTDLVFGTHYCPSAPPEELGIAEVLPSSYAGLLWAPFRCTPVHVSNRAGRAQVPTARREVSSAPKGVRASLGRSVY